jgi:hypothetical protein
MALADRIKGLGIGSWFFVCAAAATSTAFGGAFLMVRIGLMGRGLAVRTLA